MSKDNFNFNEFLDEFTKIFENNSFSQFISELGEAVKQNTHYKSEQWKNGELVHKEEWKNGKKIIDDGYVDNKLCSCNEKCNDNCACKTIDNINEKCSWDELAKLQHENEILRNEIDNLKNVIKNLRDENNELKIKLDRIANIFN